MCEYVMVLCEGVNVCLCVLVCLFVCGRAPAQFFLADYTNWSNEAFESARASDPLYDVITDSW